MFNRIKQMLKAIRRKWHNDIHARLDVIEDIIRKNANMPLQYLNRGGAAGSDMGAAALRDVKREVQNFRQEQDRSLRMISNEIQSMKTASCSHAAVNVVAADAHNANQKSSHDELAVFRQNIHDAMCRITESIQEIKTCSNRHAGDEIALGIEEWTAWKNELLNTLRTWQIATLSNQISLSNPGADRCELLSPWSTAASATLFRNGSGRLCFSPHVGKISDREPVSVFSIPKCGTHYTAAALVELGFSGIIPMYACMDVWMDPDPSAPPVHLDLTPSLYHDLLLPGQIGVGHITSKEFLGGCKDQNIIVPIRDLRYAAVSCARMDKKYCSVEVLTPKDVISCLNTPFDLAPINILFQAASAVVGNMNELEGKLVRFEEMASMDQGKMKASLAVIANATRFSPEEVFSALKRAFGAKTITFTGSLTEISGIWTREVEDAFVARGYDVLNERLGYSRVYVPEK